MTSDEETAFKNLQEFKSEDSQIELNKEGKS